MTDTNAVVAIYESHSGAENAVKELQRSGFDMKKLSVVGKDVHTDERVVGYYNAGDRMKYWRVLGRSLGPAVRCGILLAARRRPAPRRGTAGGVDRRRLGGRCRRRRAERGWRRPVQHRHTEGQRFEI